MVMLVMSGRTQRIATALSLYDGPAHVSRTHAPPLTGTRERSIVRSVLESTADRWVRRVLWTQQRQTTSEM
jgi:hypothetical protein